ncbi:hypothetical protein NMG95_02330 [Metamycoplasma hyosynoviae]|nr:hypothetical protein [Metamycoplasma hyosynoviae]UTO27064.1 hypothetical protein NMG95_02330 [Metamycoplasma hyosynoviae]
MVGKINLAIYNPFGETRKYFLIDDISDIENTEVFIKGVWDEYEKNNISSIVEFIMHLWEAGYLMPIEEEKIINRKVDINKVVFIEIDIKNETLKVGWDENNKDFISMVYELTNYCKNIDKNLLYENILGKSSIEQGIGNKLCFKMPKGYLKRLRKKWYCKKWLNAHCIFCESLIFDSDILYFKNKRFCSIECAYKYAKQNAKK